MRTRILALLMCAAAVVPAGCAAGFRAGGPRAGVSAGAAVGPDRPIVVETVPVRPGP